MTFSAAHPRLSFLCFLPPPSLVARTPARLINGERSRVVPRLGRVRQAGARGWLFTKRRVLPPYVCYGANVGLTFSTLRPLCSGGGAPFRAGPRRRAGTSRVTCAPVGVLRMQRAADVVHGNRRTRSRTPDEVEDAQVREVSPTSDTCRTIRFYHIYRNLRRATYHTVVF